MIAILIFFVLGFAACAALAIRNSVVFGIRMRFLVRSGDVYHRLPSYDDMMLNPRHWGRWTFRQWCAWLAANGRGSAR